MRRISFYFLLLFYELASNFGVSESFQRDTTSISSLRNIKRAVELRKTNNRHIIRNEKFSEFQEETKENCREVQIQDKSFGFNILGMNEDFGNYEVSKGCVNDEKVSEMWRNYFIKKGVKLCLVKENGLFEKLMETANLFIEKCKGKMTIQNERSLSEIAMNDSNLSKSKRSLSITQIKTILQNQYLAKQRKSKERIYKRLKRESFMDLNPWDYQPEFYLYYNFGMPMIIFQSPTTSGVNIYELIFDEKNFSYIKLRNPKENIDTDPNKMNRNYKKGKGESPEYNGDGYFNEDYKEEYSDEVDEKKDVQKNPSDERRLIERLSEVLLTTTTTLKPSVSSTVFSITNRPLSHLMKHVYPPWPYKKLKNL